MQHAIRSSCFTAWRPISMLVLSDTDSFKVPLDRIALPQFVYAGCTFGRSVTVRNVRPIIPPARIRRYQVLRRLPYRQPVHITGGDGEAGAVEGCRLFLSIESLQERRRGSVAQEQAEVWFEKVD
ncbi:hypothetical protein GY45DRAFT_331070 [Cubamyces sp. BRFM 1775]|nr:hypothetical protein GY45DRAFT_331070 [Cubamyces sp. BRFM 1775]